MFKALLIASAAAQCSIETWSDLLGKEMKTWKRYDESMLAEETGYLVKING
jgi:hypothetical protein